MYPGPDSCWGDRCGSSRVGSREGQERGKITPGPSFRAVVEGTIFPGDRPQAVARAHCKTARAVVAVL